MRRVFCVAGSYAKAGTPGAKPQLHIFMKPADAVVPIGPNDVFDMAVEEDEEPLMPEVELVACLSKGGRAMSLEEAARAGRELAERESLPLSEAARRVAAMTGYRKSELYQAMLHPQDEA